MSSMLTPSLYRDSLFLASDDCHQFPERVFGLYRPEFTGIVSVGTVVSHEEHFPFFELDREGGTFLKSERGKYVVMRKTSCYRITFGITGLQNFSVLHEKGPGHKGCDRGEVRMVVSFC